MILYYILDDDNNVVPVDDVTTWGYWFEEASHTGRRFVAHETLDDDTHISTVFLGLDHSLRWPGGADPRPLVFETMIFYAGDYGDEAGQWRYSTWTEALAGHDQAVMLARKVVAETRAQVDHAIERLTTSDETERP